MILRLPVYVTVLYRGNAFMIKGWCNAGHTCDVTLLMLYMVYLNNFTSMGLYLCNKLLAR